MSVPANTSATVYILAAAKENVTESGKSLAGNPSIKYLRNQDKYVVFEVESGEYQFISKGSKSLLKNTILSNPIIHPGDTLANVHDSVRVNITSNVAEALIHFTTDGSNPDSDSPVFKGPFFVSRPMIIRAKATLRGYESSFTKSNYIDFINPEENGLTYVAIFGVIRNRGLWLFESGKCT